MTCGEEQPQSRCPACRVWQDDLDGSGVLCCAACGYCAHASQSGDGRGNWVCNTCDKTLEPLRTDASTGAAP